MLSMSAAHLCLISIIHIFFKIRFQLLLLFALVAYVYSAPGVQAPGPNEAVTNEINFKRQAGMQMKMRKTISLTERSILCDTVQIRSIMLNSIKKSMIIKLSSILHLNRDLNH